MLGHINLTLTAYLPIAIILLLRLLDRRGRAVRTGLILGAMTVLQFFTGFEVLALTFVTVALFALGVLVARPDVLVTAWRPLVTGTATAAGLCLVVLAYPLWFYLSGPRHVVGPYWKVTTNRLWDIVDAGDKIYRGDGPLRAVGYLGARGPNTMYLGVGLIIFVAVSARYWRRRSSMVIVAATGVVCWLLESFPAKWWDALPGVESIALARFALPVSLCVALLCCASIDGWWDATSRWPTVRDQRTRRRARIAVVAMVVAAFIPLLVTYSVPLEVERPTVPAWFRLEARELPPTYAVLTIPFAYDVQSHPMAWQAETAMSFNLVGGWAFVPGANQLNDEIISPFTGVVADLRTLSSHPLSITRAEQMAIRSALRRGRPLVVVVVPRFANACARSAMQDTLGLHPTFTDGSWVWTLRTSTDFGPVHTPRASGCL